MTKQQQIKNDKAFYGNCYCNKYENYICVDEMGNLFNPDYVSKKFTAIANANNLENATIKTLRHTFASILLHENCNMKEIQIMMEHAKYETTSNIYAHIQKEDVKQKVGKTIMDALQPNN